MEYNETNATEAQSVTHGDDSLDKSDWNYYRRNPKRGSSPPSGDEIIVSRLLKKGKVLEREVPARGNAEQDFFHGFSSTQTPNSGNIILVKPVSDSQNLNNNTSVFFNNDIQLAKNLDNSILGNIGIDNVRKNVDKDILVVYLKKNVNGDLLNEILTIDHIGNWKVDCRLPQHQKLSFGVIGPVELDTDLVELLEYLKENDPKIMKIQRLFKGKRQERTLSKCIKICYDSPNLPEHIKVGYQRFKVSVFIDAPWQCFNCQRFGHNAANCRSQQRCLLCGRNHKLSECEGKTRPNFNTKCANCGGAHAANYGGCQKYKEAKQVEKVRSEKRLSYSDAVRTIKESNDQENPSRTSSIKPTPKMPVVPLETQSKKTNERSSQTEPPKEERSYESLIINFTKIILEMIKNKNNYNLEEKCNEMVKNIFDIDLGLEKSNNETKKVQDKSQDTRKTNKGNKTQSRK